jgi:hypothetical protein
MEDSTIFYIKIPQLKGFYCITSNSIRNKIKILVSLSKRLGEKSPNLFDRIKLMS